jgi:lipid II isoglutaminyl synthase (glutamine-hydrolysing)
MIDILLIIIGKFVVFVSRILNLGNGSTWPGHIALSVNKNLIKDVLNDSKVKVILIAGTNGKTTTGKLIQSILEENNKNVFQNEGGANLLNGIASSLISNSNLAGKINKDFAVFEIDENTLPLILQQINNPSFIMVLNLFRDQLDRYGEVNIIAGKWREAFAKLNNKTTLILNADDPQVSSLGLNLKANVNYFGINSKNKTEKIQHASDSTHCPNCGEKLSYNSTYFSHLGDWHCKKCNYKHPEKTFTTSPYYPLLGIYNEYNTNAAVLLTNKLELEKEKTLSALKNFEPAFGRQEILNIDGKKVQIFLSKNPTGLNESLKTIASLNAKNLLIILNDRIPDGRDVSWIWDVDFDEVKDLNRLISVAGDRAYDMALRLKYENIPIEDKQIYTDLEDAIFSSLQKTPKSETLYILPTYSAMLEVRKILTGKKIL